MSRCPGMAVWLTGVVALALPSRLEAADLDLAVSHIDIEHPDEGGHLYFGGAAAGGDFDGDGFDDLAVGEIGPNRVYVYPGSPQGLDQRRQQVLTPQTVVLRDDLFGSFGSGIASIDVNADGFDDLAVGTGDARNPYVFVYSGGPSGLVLASEVVLSAPEWEESLQFGVPLVDAGDTDGDGFPELLTSADDWGMPALGQPIHVGALFLYSGGSGGIDECPHILIVSPPQHDFHSSLGHSVAGGGDLNGDGYSDFASSCEACGDDWSSPFVYWLGAADLPQGPHLGVGTGTGFNVAIVGDLDADGFDELAVSAELSGTLVYYGGPNGPNSNVPALWDEAGGSVSAAGDLDVDGFDDVVLGTYWNERVGVVFGGAARADNPTWLDLPAPADPHYWGSGVFGVGDLDGEGRPDIVASDMYSESLSGMVRVFFPACTWYADADADGAGDPTVTLSTCRDPGAGWAAHPDDCDDSDATSRGTSWFPDDDGDGFGVTSKLLLACTAPDGAADRAGDCDDQDGSRHPGLDDLDVDGIDQDCDGHDGPWLVDTGDCPDPTDTGDTGPADSGGPEGAETGDASSPGDSGPESVTNLRDPECGCGAGGAQPSLLTVVAAAVVAGHRRRAQATVR